MGEIHLSAVETHQGSWSVQPVIVSPVAPQVSPTTACGCSQVILQADQTDDLEQKLALWFGHSTSELPSCVWGNLTPTTNFLRKAYFPLWKWKRPASSAAKTQAHSFGSTEQVHPIPISEPETSDSVNQASVKLRLCREGSRAAITVARAATSLARAEQSHEYKAEKQCD